MNEDQLAARQELVDVVSSVPDAPADMLQACRKIVALRQRLGPIPIGLLDPIIAIESELEDVPGEASFVRWDPAALQRKMKKRDEYLARVQGILLASFRRLRQWLESGGRE